MPTIYEDVTDPMMTDSTGQEIKGVLQQIKSVIQPTNVCVDLDVSLDVNGWSNSAPYIYNWMNNKVTSECAVKVNFLEDSEDTDQLYIAYEKIVGGIQFEAPTKPTEAIPVRIHIVNAQADSITSISDDMVSSSVVAGTANVQEALGALNEQISNMKVRTLSQIGISSTPTTISAIWTALPNYCEIYVDAGLVTDAYRSTGVMHFLKHSSFGRGIIEFYAKVVNDSDARMYLNADNSPSGVWTSLSEQIAKSVKGERNDSNRHVGYITASTVNSGNKRIFFYDQNNTYIGYVEFT